MRPTRLLLCVVIIAGLITLLPMAHSNNDAKAVPAKTAKTNSPALVGVLQDIGFECGKEGEVVLLKGQNLNVFKYFKLTDPFRVVLDLQDTEKKFDRSIIQVGDDVIQQIRVSQFKQKGRLRIVLDLKKNITAVDVKPDGDGLKIILGNLLGEKQSTQADSRPAEIPLEVTSTTAITSTEIKEQENVASKGVPTTDLKVEFTDASIVKIADPVVKPRENPQPEPQVPPAEPVRLMAAKARSEAVSFLQDDTAQTTQYTGEPISLDIKDADIVDFFRLISDAEGLNIVVDPSVHGVITLKVENVPWDQVFDLALRNNKLDKTIEGNVVRIGTMEAFRDEENAREELKRTKDTTTELIKVNYATVKDLLEKNLIKPLLTRSGQVNLDERTNSLVVRDIPERITEVRKLIKALDVPEHQVEIEARVIAANRNFARSIGIQAGFVGGNLQRITVGGTNTVAGLSGYRPSATPTTGFASGSVDGDGRVAKGASSSSASQSATVATGGDGKTGNLNLNMPAVGATSGIGISIGNIYDTFLLDASITAAENKGEVMVISQPKIQAQNNRQASIEQGIQIPVQTNINNTTTVQFFSASLRLEVTPRVTEEGTVFLKIKLENNRPDFTRPVNGIPAIITSQTITEVLVADGGTTVMGGVLIDQDSKNYDKVPLLGDVPVLGHLFRRDSKVKETQEILFFLTPRIVR